VRRAARSREPLILLGLLVVSFLVTWPLGRKLFSQFYVDGDPSASAWSLWWTKERLFSLDHPWSATELFAPAGAMLAFSAHFPLAGAVLSPVTAVLGPAVTLNLTKLALPALLSYVAYRLAREFGLPTAPALASGILYGCSAELVYRADVHFNFAAGALIPPLTLLFVARYRREGRLLNAAVAGAVVGAGMLLDPTNVVFAVLAGLSYVVGVTVQSRGAEAPRLARGLLAAGLAALVFASPQLVAMKVQRDAGRFTSDVPTLAGSWVLYGQSVQSLFTPSPSFRLIEPVRELGNDHRSGEGFPTYGWGLLALGLTGLVAAWRRPLIRWLGLLWLVATVVALGPTLKVGESTFVPAAIERHGYELSALMPYTWYVQLPGFADQRVAARFIMLGLLPAALLAGFGIRALWARARWGQSLLALALVVCALDLGSPVSFLGEIEQPELYEPIRRDRSDSIVVDVPLSWVTGTRFVGTPTNVQSMLRATEHGHPIAYGVVGRADVDMLASLARNRFYTDLMVQQGGADFSATGPPPPPDPRVGAANARELGVGWAVVQPTAARAVSEYLVAAGFQLVVDRDGVRVFRADFRSSRTAK
jgi:hypothetical protein